MSPSSANAGREPQFGDGLADFVGGDTGAKMDDQPRYSIFRMILSLSDALNLLSPEFAHHQQRVAFIALKIAGRMDFKDRELIDIFLAAALHDIGKVNLDHTALGTRVSNRQQQILCGEYAYELLCENEIFERAAHIIRCHRTRWTDEQYDGSDKTALAGQIVYLSDCVERSIDRDVYVLEQSQEIMNAIRSRSSNDFDPNCIAAFEDLARTEAFWLDCTSRRMYSLVHDLLVKTVDDVYFAWSHGSVNVIAEIFAKIVDSISRWTATHTTGVAATAVSLAKLTGFSELELKFIETAALLHDLGKLSVPTSILDKKGSLTRKEWLVITQHAYHTYRILETTGFPRQITEWAAYHHERIDGNGYPFHIAGDRLTLGSRIMAVADTFTAFTEDRPYRGSLSAADTIVHLHEKVQEGALDQNVVDLLCYNLDEIDGLRRKNQMEYSRRKARTQSV